MYHVRMCSTFDYFLICTEYTHKKRIVKKLKDIKSAIRKTMMIGKKQKIEIRKRILFTYYSNNCGIDIGNYFLVKI